MMRLSVYLSGFFGGVSVASNACSGPMWLYTSTAFLSAVLVLASLEEAKT